MAKLGPKQTAEMILATQALDAPPRPIIDVISATIRALTNSGVDQYELASRWHKPVRQYLEWHWEECLAEGRQPKFAFNSSSDYMIQGPCYIEPGVDSEAVRNQKKSRLHWVNYYEALRTLGPKDFEVLCKQVLGLLGVQQPVLTRYVADEGVDFYGRLSLADLVGRGPVYPVFESSLQVWLLGQAKHYIKTRVATPDIRDLVGAVTLGRAHAFGAGEQKMYAGLEIRVCDPVFMLFFTTGEISLDGWRLCRRSGVIAMDGEMLAAFLADKKVGIVIHRGKPEFQKAAFLAWLGS